MLTLKTNSANVLFRCFSLVAVLILGYFFINQALINPKTEKIIFGKIKVIYFGYLFIGLLAYLVLLYVISFLAIIKVQIDTFSNSITFISLVKKRVIALNDVDSYTTTSHSNQFKVFEGLLINLKSGKIIQVVGQNLKSISDFKEYLISKEIPCLGSKKMKYPFN